MTKITAIHKKILHGDCSVYATIDGEEELLFNYYIDELSFDKDELIGLTADEAIELKHQKDVAYLRS